MMRPPAEWAVGGFIMLKSEAKQNISDLLFGAKQNNSYLCIRKIKKT